MRAEQTTDASPKGNRDRIYKGQRYVWAGTVPHRRQNGTETELTVWVSWCAECGEKFEFMTPVNPPVWQPSRRCRAHRQPGVRV